MKIQNFEIKNSSQNKSNEHEFKENQKLINEIDAEYKKLNRLL